MDGKQGLSFGVRPGNRHRVCEAPKKGDVDEVLRTTPWGKMTPDQKRANFFHNFDWELVLSVFQNAGIIEKALLGQCSACLRNSTALGNICFFKARVCETSLRDLSTAASGKSLAIDTHLHYIVFSALGLWGKGNTDQTIFF